VSVEKELHESPLKKKRERRARHLNDGGEQMFC